MPLVEPLEYREVRRIKEFVIAVDTSASTSGELVQRFLQKTYNILKSSESYFTRVNIHIIQCDAAIQEHVKISNEEELDSYIGTMSIKGLGGTDFRPVFSLVDRLAEEGELTDLKGLIYFTDGRGVFPARKPDYETAFVFLDNEYNDPEVPPWAIRIVLQNEDV
jgi:predicted metal-dependent peptidase